MSEQKIFEFMPNSPDSKKELTDLLTQGWKIVQSTPVLQSGIYGGSTTTQIIYILEKTQA